MYTHVHVAAITQLLVLPLAHLRYALGFNPSSLAFSSLISRQAEAPSVCNCREGGRERGRERSSDLKVLGRYVRCVLLHSGLSTARDQFKQLLRQ